MAVCVSARCQCDSCVGVEMAAVKWSIQANTFFLSLRELQSVRLKAGYNTHSDAVTHHKVTFIMRHTWHVSSFTSSFGIKQTFSLSLALSQTHPDLRRHWSLLFSSLLCRKSRGQMERGKNMKGWRNFQRWKEYPDQMWDNWLDSGIVQADMSRMCSFKVRVTL